MQARNNYRKPFKREREHNINTDITAPEIRLVGENITPGVYSLQAALDIAKGLEIDLVEISPGAVPPVCKLIDYTNEKNAKRNKKPTHKKAK